MRKSVDVEFWIGEYVYHRIDKENNMGLVVAVMVFDKDQKVSYKVVFPDGESWYFGMELSREECFDLNGGPVGLEE